VTLRNQNYLPVQVPIGYARQVQRDKHSTKRRLIAAVQTLIREQGFAALGVNAIAEEAGVSKVLIYRYFGDLDGLFRAVADELDMLKSDTIVSAFFENPGRPLHERVKEAFLTAHRELAADELTMQLMIQELSGENELTRALAEARERQGVALTRKLSSELGGRLDLNLFLTLASSGIYYLTLRSRSVRYYNGIDIQSDGGWERLCSLLADIVVGTSPSSRK
jgi:AcrR family transcriptional regulator